MDYREDRAPPRDWQDFEDLCLELWRPKLLDAKKNGRQGQPQAGVDIFGKDPKTEEWVGIQCKQKGQWPPQVLTIAQMKAEIRRAAKFKPALSHFIIATTAKRDARSQEFVRRLGFWRRKGGNFTMALYAWDDIQEWLQETSGVEPGSYPAEVRPGTAVETQLPPSAVLLGKSTTGPAVSPDLLPTTSRILEGRKRELAYLNQAWVDRGTFLVSIVGRGGEGKTALVKRWLHEMAREQFQNATSVFTWSFYNQGLGNRATSADQFVHEALLFFGDPDPTVGSQYDRGKRLAKFVGSSRNLLVLDGLEPLQYPPGPLGGRLKDQALAALVTGLSYRCEGLCIITSRVALPELDDAVGSTALVMDLKPLTGPSGASLLEKMGVRGALEDRLKISQDADGHALTLSLIGSFLVTFHNGDIRSVNSIDLIDEDIASGGYGSRILRSYERWFGDDSPEISLLRLLGLFDRPVESDVLDVLRSRPAIGKLTGAIVNLREREWARILKRLNDLGLIVLKTKFSVQSESKYVVDAHPLIRSYFAAEIQKHDFISQAKDAHARLYRHLSKIASLTPETLSEMAPLYDAVAHGCRAGLVQEALDEVYISRIQRGNEYFGTSKLGAIGASLAALSNFFYREWDRPSNELSEGSRAFLMNHTGFCLRAVCRFQESLEVLKSALEAYQALEDWERAADTAGIIALLLFPLGDLAAALSYAKQSVTFADQSASAFQQTLRRATVGTILHHSGDAESALRSFREAELIQQTQSAEFPLLLNFEGFFFNLLLNDRGNYEEVLRRTDINLRWGEREGLTLARKAFIFHCRALALEGTGRQLEAKSSANVALDCYRKSGRQDYLPYGLLLLAAILIESGATDESERLIQEAHDVCRSSGMRLHEADCYLEKARLCQRLGRKREQWANADRANVIAESIGYHRHDARIGELLERT